MTILLYALAIYALPGLAVTLWVAWQDVSAPGYVPHWFHLFVCVVVWVAWPYVLYQLVKQR